MGTTALPRPPTEKVDARLRGGDEEAWAHRNVRHTALVLMLVSETKVRWTGHFFAISRSFDRCSSLNGPTSSTSSSIRSIFPSLVSHSAQSVAWILECRS